MIVSVRGDEITEGIFVGNSEVIGATREECLESLRNSHAFAEDFGSFTREDGAELYKMVGGSIYKIEISGTVSFERLEAEGE